MRSNHRLKLQHTGERTTMAEDKCMEILVSFNFQDVHLAEALRAGLFLFEPDRHIVLSPASYGAVLFEKNIAAGVYEADAFLFLVGPSGISDWQKTELDFALDRRKYDVHFAVMPVLAGNSQVPAGLMAYDFRWIQLPVVTDRTALARVGKLIAPNPAVRSISRSARRRVKVGR